MISKVLKSLWGNQHNGFDSGVVLIKCENAVPTPHCTHDLGKAELLTPNIAQMLRCPHTQKAPLGLAIHSSKLRPVTSLGQQGGISHLCPPSYGPGQGVTYSATT